MTCSDYHRLLLIEPRSRDPRFLAHTRACPECERLRAEALAFEARLDAALKAEAAYESRPEDRETAGRRGPGLNPVLALLLLAVSVLAVLLW
jgi:hypothetical protein